MYKSCSVTTALCFAAGKGERMQPLTYHTPKPLLAPYGEPMLAAHVRCLVAAGISRILINGWYLAEHIAAIVSQLQKHYPAVRFIYVHEKGNEPLETGGGICHALPHVQGDHILTINTDMLFPSEIQYVKYIRYLRGMPAMVPADYAGVLMLVPTLRAYGYHGAGDFTYAENSRHIRLRSKHEDCAPFVYPGVQVLPCSAFTHEPVQRWGLRAYYEKNQGLYGVVYRGQWLHIGTPAALVGAARKKYSGI